MKRGNWGKMKKSDKAECVMYIRNIKHVNWDSLGHWYWDALYVLVRTISSEPTLLLLFLFLPDSQPNTKRQSNRRKKPSFWPEGKAGPKSATMPLPDWGSIERYCCLPGLPEGWPHQFCKVFCPVFWFARIWRQPGPVFPAKSVNLKAVWNADASLLDGQWIAKWLIWCPWFHLRMCLKIVQL